MLRVVACQVLMFAALALCFIGCSSSPPPDLASGEDSLERQLEVVIPETPEAVIQTAGEPPGPMAREATSERQPTIAEIADGADSDEPDSYHPHASQEVDHVHEPPLPEGDEPSKRNGRADGDDPAAALVIAKVADEQEEVALNDGRDPTARPIPEAERVAARPGNTAEPSEFGRAPAAKPGTEIAPPVKAVPTVKLVRPARKTLAELSEAVQALDKDGDGQLGLYEWPRARLPEFKKLDSDQDGFLTPAELFAGQKKLSEAKSQEKDQAPAAGTQEAETKEEDNKPAAGAPDKTETDASADEPNQQDGTNADDQPEQGS